MIKKYRVNQNSVFAKTIILSFYDRNSFFFDIDWVGGDLRNTLFSTKNLKFSGKNRELVAESLPTTLHTIYLDDGLKIKALICYNKANKTYYCFKDSGKKNGLRYQDNYKSCNLSELESSTEIKFRKSTKDKKFFENWNYSDISDINYFEYKYEQELSNRINDESNLVCLTFRESTKFVSDFIKLFKDKIYIPNGVAFNKEALTNNTMGGLTTNRCDSVFVDASTGEIKYFIYMYKPEGLNHYMLFENLGNDNYRFIKESVSFNSLFSLTETKDIEFRFASDFETHAMINFDYDEFGPAFAEFVEDEKIDEEFNSEQELLKQIEIENAGKIITLNADLVSLLNQYDCTVEGNVLYFFDFEVFPLAYFGDGYVKFKQNRNSSDESYSNQMSLKDLSKIENKINELLYKRPSSRVMFIEKLVESIIGNPYVSGDKEQESVIKEINDNISMLWKNDKKFPDDQYFNKIYVKFRNWLNNQVSTKVVKPIVTPKPTTAKVIIGAIQEDVGLTKHADERISERIKKMSYEEKLQLATLAYNNGEKPVDYLFVDENKCEFLQYKQSKHLGKTLRLYDGNIFIFSLAPPHDLVTCFDFESSYKWHLDHKKKKKK